MKRDIDLLRRILLDLESGSSVHDAGEDPQTLHYHIQLLHDAGLIVADELVPGQWWPERITWAGHEFLDLARNDISWNRTKCNVASKVSSAPFAIVQELLARDLRSALGSARTKRSNRANVLARGHS